MLHAIWHAGYHKLVLCHLNHGLRGDESDDDAHLVRQLAEAFDLPFELGHTDVPARMKEKKESMELAARRSRHTFFAKCSNIHNCSRVLLAHHADDQAETILHNLLRGSAGLSGMPFSNQLQIPPAPGAPEQPLQLLRPLLHIRRSEINLYLDHHKLNYREDSSNREAITTRNRLRLKAIPMLNDIMDRDIAVSILRAHEISNAQQQAIHAILNEQNLFDPQGRIFLPKLRQLPEALQLSAIHQYLKNKKVPDLSQDVIARCHSLINDPNTAKVNLPGGYHFQRKEKRLFVTPSQPSH